MTITISLLKVLTKVTAKITWCSFFASQCGVSKEKKPSAVEKLLTSAGPASDTIIHTTIRQVARF